MQNNVEQDYSIDSIEDGCSVTIETPEGSKKYKVDVENRKYQQSWIGKSVGDVINLPSTPRGGIIVSIEKKAPPIPPDPPIPIDPPPPRTPGRGPLPRLTQAELLQKFRNVNINRGVSSNEARMVLISVVPLRGYISFAYHDGWIGESDEMFVFSGEGMYGDQVITPANRELMDAKITKKPIFIFTKFTDNEFYYQGEFECYDFTTRKLPDANGKLRNEFRFILKKVGR
ncbi:MAG: hypothetical protein IJY24_00220 [Clostridia bacterium]|nr:hypothetical protein [Clostridia bacterium]